MRVRAFSIRSCYVNGFKVFSGCPKKADKAKLFDKSALKAEVQCGETSEYYRKGILVPIDNPLAQACLKITVTSVDSEL